MKMVACLQISSLFKVGRGDPSWGCRAKVHQHWREVLGQQHIVWFDVPDIENAYLYFWACTMNRCRTEFLDTVTYELKVETICAVP